MSKKIHMFSNGTAVIREAGKTRKANLEEVTEYLVSLVPQKKKGAELEAVKYDEGTIYARYADKKVYKKVFALNSVEQTEPVNSIEKATPDVKVPRDKSKAKPEIDVKRPDVNKPTEVRNKEYNKGGDGGADSHTKVVPRSKNNSGLEGGSKTSFEDESGDKATSGNQDTYVQNFTSSEKPAKAGNKENHTAGSDVEIKPAELIYSKIKIAKENGENEDKKEEKDDAKNKKSKDFPFNKKKDCEEGDDKDTSDKKDEKKEAKLLSELKEAQEEVKKLKAEMTRSTIRANRQKSAIKLALAYRDLNPVKYASVDSFGEKVEDISKKMDVEAIETALAELITFHSEAFNNQQELKKTASKETSPFNGLELAFGPTKEDYNSGSAVESGSGSLKEILMSGTSLGRKMADFEAYTPHVKQ